MSQKSTTASRAIALGAVFAMLLSACGSDAATDASTEATDAPQTTEAAVTDEGATESTETVNEDMGGDDMAPMHIVSLSPSSTEILFAIGAGDQVVAVDSLSNYPDEAPTTDLSAFEPSLEAIIGYEPDLVVLSYDPGEIVAGLEQAGVAAVVHPAAATLDDVYAQVADLGVLTGQVDGAAELNASIQADLAAIVESIPADSAGSVYHEIDQTFYSAASASFIGQVYTMLGIINIADEADTEGFGYPQLSPEYIIEANPSMIVITDQGGYTSADVAARPGWGVIAAVANNNVVMVSADAASRWGPRVVDFVQVIADQVVLVPAS